MQTTKLFLHGYRKKYFVAIALSLLLGINSGFTTIWTTNAHTRIQYPEIEWVLDKTVSDVEFYHAITICNDKNVVFLKFVNRNSHPVKISWKEVFITKNNEQKEGFTGKKELIVPPGINIPSNCSDTNHPLLIINSSQVDPTSIIEISNFMFTDISVQNQ